MSRTKGANTYDRSVLVAKIAMMRIKSKSTHFILDWLQEEIGMGRATAYLVLNDAQQYILDMAQKDVNKCFEEAIQQLEDKMDEASKDKRVWLEYRKELSKMRALYMAQKIDVTSDGKAITSVDINIIYTKPDEPKD